MTWPWRKPDTDNFDFDGDGGTTTTANLASRNSNETVGTLNPSRDNASTYEDEAHRRDHDGGDQGVEVRNSDVPHMNANGASLTLSGVDTSDNFYEGEDEDDGGHAEVVLEARRMRGHVAAMFHSSQKITKALIGLSLFISMIIFSAGIGGIISHNKEVTVRNFAVTVTVTGGEDCPESSKGSKAPNKGSKTKGGSNVPARRLESLRGMKGDIKTDTKKRNLASSNEPKKSKSKGLKKSKGSKKCRSPSGPQTASYDAALGAPKCGYGLQCDSGGLLNGRGNINGGAEPNQPNTLDSCTDRLGGTYHFNESIDKIIVTRVTGGDGDLTEGDEVKITATVWCFGTGFESFIDFYYAADASNPDWTQIGNRQVCTGGGQKTMTATFTLPQGALQAVRARIFYREFGRVDSLSSSSGMNSCTSGGFDDTDDLVISVQPNPSIQGLVASPSESKHDDVQGQGAIVYAEKDAEADEMEKILQQMNESNEKPTVDVDHGF